MKAEINQDNIKDSIFETDGEIDLSYLLSPITRNKLFVGSITLLFFLFACFYALSRKRVWEGKFQIVLSSQIEKGLDLPGLLGSSSRIAQRIGDGISTGPNFLKTEVEILKSPVLLGPIYEFVKETKSKPKNQYNKNFQLWRDKKLTLRLKDSTSVLTVKYIDTEKDEIIPVLKNIKNSYQKYSSDRKKVQLKSALIYLDNQISIYKNKSSESIRTLQEYAIDNDLKSYDFYFQKKENLVGSDIKVPNNLSDFVGTATSGSSTYSLSQILSNINIENLRVNLSNEINTLNKEISEIEKGDLNLSQLNFIGTKNKVIFPFSLSEQFNMIEVKLIELKSKYRDTDLDIKRLTDKKKMMTELYQNQILSVLKSRIERLKYLESTSKNPKELYVKYKELIREASRNENILIDLENKSREIQLKQAKLEDPWNVITSPTLKKSPVAPQRGLIVFIGTLIGVSAGIVLSFIKERITGKIYDQKELENSLKSTVIEKIYLPEQKLFFNSKEVFLNEIIGGINNEFVFIKSSEVSDYQMESFMNIISNQNKEFQIKSNFNEVKDQNIIIVSILGEVKRNNNENLLKRIILSNKKIWGIILLSEKNS